MSPDRQLLTTLGVLRRQWRQRILLESLVWIVFAVLLAIVAAMVVLRAFNGGGNGPLVARVMGYALIIASIIRFLFVPLLRRASDARFALYVEERAPQLKQALISAVQEAHTPEPERASSALAARLMTRASAAIRPLQERAALERPRMLRASKTLGALTVVAVAMFALGPTGLRDSARLLFVPWSTAQAATPMRTVRVLPGNATVPRGSALEVHASLVGFAADGAELVFRPDSASEWVRLPMSRDADSTGFRGRMFDLVKPAEYYVESADVRSPTYTLRVSDLPAVKLIALDLRFPAYSGLPVEHIADGGDVAAVVGTTVVVHAAVTRAVKSGVLHFDDGTIVAMAIDTGSTVMGSFKVSRSGFYRVDLITPDGATVAGAVQYVVDAIPDRPPTVSIESPGRDTKVANTDEVTIAVRASDDLGVTSLELRYRVNGGEEKRVPITDSLSRKPRDARGAHTLFLEELGLEPGDLVAYNALAKDGAGHVGSSDVYFLEVRPLSKNYKQAEQQGGGGGGGGGGQDSPDGFVARQRDVVAGTFNWLRDSSATAAKKRREDITTLTIAEGRLREDVAGLAKRMTDRGVATSDTTFAKIQKELVTAVVDLKDAEERLGRQLGRDALPGEQKALQHLQRAEALYRDVQVQIGQQGGGGGGGGSGKQQKAEDLADLFGLETDKLKNQYEAVQQQSQQAPQAQKAVDESLERLKQLAQRQQQENDRMQRMADALRERLGRESSAGGGGGAQRELAKQAEEEARRLERLSREQNSPELADAAQKMQQAADAMKRAASGSASQGAAALDELKRATRGLEGTKTASTNKGIQQLADKAKDLEARQREIADGVAAMHGAAGEQRAEQQRRLAEKKDLLSADVQKLEADADRVARDGRKDQPKAAGQIGAAADAIRDTRIKDKIDFSKNVMRGGSPEYANSFEGQIADNLKDVADRLGAAAGAMQGESATTRQERALDKTRDLVKGLESLRERVADRAQQGKGQQGQQGKQGQAQGQGEGQQGQGQQGQGQGQQQGEGQGQGRGQPQQGGGRGAPNNAASGGMPGSVPTGAMPPGEAQQFAREFRLRRENAEALRGDLAKQGVDTKELDRAIANMRELESGKPFNDPKALQALQAAMLEGLKGFEFSLYRTLGLGAEGRPALGAQAAVPAEYRAMIDEYYRSLASERKKKP